MFSSSLLFHRQNVHWPSFKEAATVKQPCLHGAKSSQTWWQNCGFLQWRGIMSPLSFSLSKIMRPCYIAFKVMVLSGKIIVLTVNRSHGNQSYFFCFTSQGHVGIALAHVLPSCQVRAERRQRGRAQGHAGLTSALCIASSLLINMCHILCLEVKS